MSLVFFIPKKDGNKQMKQDYCYLNEHMVKNNYPLPFISQLINKLKGAKMFTKMDLQWEYKNIWIKEGDKWKAVFMCYHDSFKPLVIFLGLCNSPGIFQVMMNEIFADMEDICVMYINNLMIFTKSDFKEEYNKVLLKVLHHLEENNLFIKPEKCTFHTKEVEFLGMVVGKDGVHIYDSKVKAILEWLVLKNIRGVWSFLGLANFYHWFISSYVQVTWLLNNLMKKDMPFVWNSVQQQAFDVLKEKFITTPILAYLNNDYKFQLECNSSNFATGAVLSIFKEDKWYSVAYTSHSMSPEK